MIAITTHNGTLRIAAELEIPHGQNWSPGRIQRLMMDIERYVWTAEQVDKTACAAGETGPFSKKTRPASPPAAVTRSSGANRSSQ